MGQAIGMPSGTPLYVEEVARGHVAQIAIHDDVEQTGLIEQLHVSVCHSIPQIVLVWGSGQLCPDHLPH
jgi:hypothetical protein